MHALPSIATFTRQLSTAFLFLLTQHAAAQSPTRPAVQTIPAAPSNDTWTIRTTNIDPTNYFGVTVANGMLGLVSSPDPFRAKDIVLNGAFDLYGRGRVSNILKTFNFVNCYLDIDGQRIENIKQTTRFHQTLDMKRAALTTTFD